MRPLRAALALLLALDLAACASIHQVATRPIEGGGGAVRVRVFADDDARAAGRLLGGTLVGALERKAGGRWSPVFRSLEPSWTVAGLVPGRYRVAFDARLDEEGTVEGLERSIAETIEVRAGELAEVEVVLDHVSPAMVAAGAAAIVVAAVLLHEWLDDVDLPVPPPPPDWALDAVFWISLDLASERPSWAPEAAGPAVTSHFPEAGARVAARRVRIVFALAAPLAEGSLAADAVTVRDDRGALVPGAARYDARRWWVVWEPAGELPRDARLTARFDDPQARGADGHPLAGPVEFDFTTTP